MPMYSAYDDKTFLLPDCSIRTSTDISLTYSSPWLIAVSHVLLRLSVPRHSPCALCSLTILTLHRKTASASPTLVVVPVWSANSDVAVKCAFSLKSFIEISLVLSLS